MNLPRSNGRMSRRQLFGGAPAVGATLATDAFVLEPRWFEVERRTVRLAGLDAAWQGATIALLSDSHCGPYTSPEHIARAVARTNELAPDLVLLLGDYTHRGGRYVEPGIEPFSALRAPEGVFAVLGNHDHWVGRDRSLAALRRAHVEPLVNASRILRRRADTLVIGGVGDLWEDDQRIERAYEGRSAQVPRVLMSHNPDYAEQVPARVRVDLQVSGHTHGGQVQIPGWGAPILPSRFGKKYQEGLVEGPRCSVYVTRGVSTISPPVRFSCRPEISLLTLAA